MRGRSLALAGGVASLVALAWARPWRYRPCPSELLDEVLPDYQFQDSVSVEVAADPRRVMRAVRDLRLRDMRVAWLLGEARYLPGRLTGHAIPADPDQPFLALVRETTSTVVLAERPEELALGTVGRLHDLTDQAPQPLTGARSFREFRLPGFEKLAMSIRVSGLGPDRARITLEHRTQALGLLTRLRFGLYWLVIKPVGAIVTWQMLRAVGRIAAQPQAEPTNGSTDGPEIAELVRDLEASFV